ncbi:MAG: hypothetical protein RL329_3623 [Bacteroidota bacterium]|jgi:hypothetical protein
MMKVLHATLSVLLTANALYAQRGDISSPMASAGPAKERNSVQPTSNFTNETPEQARRQVKISLNNYRGSSVTVDTLIMNSRKSMNDEVSEEVSKANFAEYLEKMERVLNGKLSLVQEAKNIEQMEERTRLYRGLMIAKSAQCLVNKTDGQFVRMKDLDGIDVICYPIESLKSNARYGLIEPYKEGFARIKKDQVFGFLNYCGDEVVQAQYETAEPFNNGKALVKKVDWFFIDAVGNESAALAGVADAKAMAHGVSLVRFANGKSAFVNNRFAETKAPLSALYDAIEPFYKKEVFKVRLGNKFGLISLNGTVKLDAVYDDIEPTNVENLYMIVQNQKIGFLDTEWRIKFQPTFDKVTPFNNFGLAIAKEGESYRLISHKTFKFSKLYKEIGDFNASALTTIRNEAGLYGIIDAELRVIIEPIYFSIGAFNDFGLAPACRSEKKCGFINKVGKETISPLYDEVKEFNKFGLVVVREITKNCTNNKTCKTDLVYDKTGKLVIDKPAADSPQKIKYEIMDSLHSERFIPIKMYKDDDFQGFHLIEPSDMHLVTTMPYQIITPFDQNQVFRVKKDNLWGLTDTSGKTIMKPMFAEIRKPSEGFYAARTEDDKWGFIDKKGKVQIPYEYDDVKTFRNGHAVVSKGGKNNWGLINKFNAKIIPCFFKTVNVTDTRYEMIDPDGKAYIVNDKGDCEQNCQKFEDMRKKANKQ